MWADFLSASRDIAGASWPNFPGQNCCVFPKYADDILMMLMVLNGKMGRTPKLFEMQLEVRIQVAAAL